MLHRSLILKFHATYGCFFKSGKSPLPFEAEIITCIVARLVFLVCLGVCLAVVESVLHNYVVRLAFPTVVLGWVTAPRYDSRHVTLMGINPQHDADKFGNLLDT